MKIETLLKTKWLLAAIFSLLFFQSPIWASENTEICSDLYDQCPCKLESDFSVSPFTISPCTRFFNEDAISNSCTNITNYSWDFGDGSTSTAANPSHTFPGDGTYIVCLTVVGNNGSALCVDTYCDTITITGCSCPCKLESDFSVSPFTTSPCTRFFNEDATSNSCTNITDYSWDFGDGSTSTAANPSHTFPGNGIYIVCLTVVGNNGLERCVDTYCDTITITGCSCPCKLESDFSISPLSISPCTRNFNEDAKTNSCTNITDYAWDFGDGGTSTAANPSHTFPGDGTYIVCLTVVGDNGRERCTDTYCDTITITGCSCPCKLESDFSVSPLSISPCTRFFNEDAKTNSCTNITDYFWDFGDGGTSTAANPSHTFPGNGTYVVCLTVVGNNGLERCVDTYCDTITIIGCPTFVKSKTGDPTSPTYIEDKSIVVYPNPFSNYLNISFDNSATRQNVEISLMDISGKQIALLGSDIYAQGAQTVTFEVGHYNLPEGIYFVQIQIGDKFHTRKVVLEK